MSDEDHNRPLGLSPAQVAGSALAAVSGAVFASWAGTTGTIIGAGVGSLIATVGAATYTWWLQRTSHVVRRTTAQVRTTTLAQKALPRTVGQGPLRPGKGAAGPRPEPGEETDGRRFPWARVALAAAVVLAIALTGITVFEALTGKPVSSITGQDDGTGTTLGHVVGSDRRPQEERPTERPTTPPPSNSPSDRQPASEPPAPSTSVPTPATPPPASEPPLESP